MGSRKGRSAGLGGASRLSRRSSFFSSSNPSPVRALTATIGAPARNEPATNSCTSRRTKSSTSRSTKSDLVMTTRPRRIPSSLQMSKCSRV